MKFPKTPAIVKPFARDLVWNMPTKEKVIYLTFDDGPTKDITDKVLDILSSYNAKATFFCLGKQVESNSDLFQRIKDEGHAVGNHSYDHLSGWGTKNINYYNNIAKADELINSKFFRPPYGRITLTQAKHLKSFYKIIMWDVLSYDYDVSVSEEECFDNVISNADNGSIIVFHDNDKAKQNVLGVLPKVLKYYNEREFRFESLTF